MNQTNKLAVLACLLAAAALGAGCVPSLNYGSVPPEPHFTTKLTTTTATSASSKPFTTPKPRTGTISWEELNGPLEYATRVRYTEAQTFYTGATAEENVGMVMVVNGYSNSVQDDNDDSSNSPQTAAQDDNSAPSIIVTAAPQDDPPSVDPSPAPEPVAGPPVEQAPEPVEAPPVEQAPEPVAGPPVAEDVSFE